MTKPLKKPLNYDEQLDNLINNHALVIDDREKAIQILKQVSYYRLSAYGIGLKKIENQEQYCEGISIDHLYRIYRFDSQLRNLLRSTCEYLEICLRSVISYHLAITYGADGFMNSNNFTDKRRKNEEKTLIHTQMIEQFQKEVKRNGKLPCVKHHKEQYGGKFPIWAAIELFTFGMLNSLCSIMKPADKKAIANAYSTDADHLLSWLQSLVEIRNICAHYGRIYNMPLAQTPRLYKEQSQYQSNRVFAVILIIHRMAGDSREWNNFKTALCALIEEYSDVLRLEYMGFPPEWEAVLNEPLRYSPRYDL